MKVPLVVAGAASAFGPVWAAGVAAVDVSSVTAGVSAQLPSVTSVALASLGIAVILKAYAYVWAIITSTGKPGRT
jgi:hypothetical protein